MSNAIRAHLAGLGIVAPVGRKGLASLLAIIADETTHGCRQPCAAARNARHAAGVGPLLACVSDPSTFKSSRNLAAWIGLATKQNSSGGKEHPGGTSKQGNHYLRQLLVVDALAVIRQVRRYGSKQAWLIALMGQRTTRATPRTPWRACIAACAR